MYIRPKEKMIPSGYLRTSRIPGQKILKDTFVKEDELAKRARRREGP